MKPGFLDINLLPAGMCRVSLSKGRAWAIVDPADYPIVVRYDWALADGYAARWGGTRMHRIILDPPPGVEVDHINGDRLDNRRSNLRFCDDRQGAQNRKVRSDSLTGFKGVNRETPGRWVARICVAGTQITIGSFASPEAAARAYDACALYYFGQFARPNFSNAVPAPVEKFQQESRQRNAARRVSPFRGVTKHSRLDSWVARIAINGEQVALGCHRTQEEAARAYDAAVRRHDLRREINFPEENA